MIDAVDSSIVKNAVANVLPNFQISNIEPLCGDASTRRYYRIRNHSINTLAVMVAANAEAVEWFQEISGLMKILCVDTPKFIGLYKQCAVLEDLGDEMLQNRMAGAGEDDYRREYTPILADLAEFQEKSASKPKNHMKCYGVLFDLEKLMWEVEFSNNHFLTNNLDPPPNDHYLKELGQEWTKLCEDLSATVPTLTHRDLHSRNIMMHDGRRVWIDYQDARMGRIEYDLASLLYDPYVNMPQGIRDELATGFFSLTVKGNRDSENSSELLNLSAAQRLYKALGTYGYQTHINKSYLYLQYIPVACQSLLYVLKKESALRRLYDLMAPALEPFADSNRD
jgi:hypothetical protein